MSLHDDLALKAFTEKRSNAEFRRAAQTNAKAMWVFITIAAIVWYFTSWGWALIPAAFGIYSAAKSVSATVIANRLQNLESRLTK